MRAFLGVIWGPPPLPPTVSLRFIYIYLRSVHMSSPLVDFYRTEIEIGPRDVRELAKTWPVGSNMVQKIGMPVMEFAKEKLWVWESNYSIYRLTTPKEAYCTKMLVAE